MLLLIYRREGASDGLYIIGNIESERDNYTKFNYNAYQTIVGADQLLVTPLQAREHRTHYRVSHAKRVRKKNH